MFNFRFRYVSLIFAVLLFAASAQAQIVTFQGLITTVAGNGTRGYSGDGGAATSAELQDPSAVALDQAGNLYIVDYLNYVIRKVNAASGVITTVAGGGAGCAGQTDSVGDGCAATSAKLSQPEALTLDGACNLYIADSGNNRFRMVNAATGVITTVAGNGTTNCVDKGVEICFSGDGGPATSAELAAPDGLALDLAGNLYIVDVLNNRVRMVNAATGIITTYAGGGSGCSNQTDVQGDGCAATSAQLNIPNGIVLDDAGNVYIADSGDYAVRKVNAATGVISTVAGNIASGVFCYPLGSPATKVCLGSPVGVALDRVGNLYIADQSSDRVFVVGAATGIMNAAAGDGTQGYSGDDGPATSAELYKPSSVALDSYGNLYIADQYNQRIREVQAAVNFGAVNVGTTSAPRSLEFGFNSDGQIGSVAVLTQGASEKDFQIAPGGTCLAGEYSSGAACTVNVTFTPLAPGARYGTVVLYDIATPPNVLGTAYISGVGDGPAVAFAPGVISTVAGNGTPGSSGNGGAATSAEMNQPNGVALDGAGNLYIADTENNVIWEVNAASGVITTVAGNGSPTCTYSFSTLTWSGTCYGGNGGAATSAELNGPTGVAVDGAGNIYIADSSNHVIREVSKSTGIINTVAGTGGAGYSGDGGPATSAELAGPGAVALDGAGNLYIADYDPGVVRMVDAATGVITTFAGGGSGIGSYSIGCAAQTDSVGDGCPATSVLLPDPEGIAFDAAGNLYISDFTGPTIRMVNAATGLISTVAGGGTGCAGQTDSDGDGCPALSAPLTFPKGVSVDAAGNLYIAEYGLSYIRRVSAATGIITRIAGGGSGCSGTVDSVGDGCSATDAELLGPDGLALDGLGNLYVADLGNNRVRKIDVSDAPTLNFVANVGAVSAAQDVVLENLGNLRLDITQIVPPANFNFGGSDTSCGSDGQNLALAGSCILSIEFAPLSAGPFNGAVTLNDDNLNNSSASQIIQLTGEGQQTGTPPAPTIISGPANPTTATTAAFTFSDSQTGVSFQCSLDSAAYAVCTSGISYSSLATGSHTFAVEAVAGAGNDSTATTYTWTINAAALTAQTITFANPGAQTAGTPLTLTATATSGLAVSFASTTASICTVSGTQATFLASGTCIIDATQAGNSTYAAAAMVAQSFTVNAAPLTAQTITFANPGAQTAGTPLTLTATATSGLAVSFASTTASICTVSGTQATFLASGTCIIDATQAGNSTYAAAAMVAQSFTVNAAPSAPSFTVASSTGAQTVALGGAATYTIKVNPVNGSYSSVVTLAASGLPTGATASFSPATVTPGSEGTSSTLTIQTATAIGAATGHRWPLAAPALALIGLFFVPGKRRRRWIALGVLLFASLGAVTVLSGCGGGFALTQSSQTYTITVTGTSGTDVQTTTVQLTVQ